MVHLVTDPGSPGGKSPTVSVFHQLILGQDSMSSSAARLELLLFCTRGNRPETPASEHTLRTRTLSFSLSLSLSLTHTDTCRDPSRSSEHVLCSQGLCVVCFLCLCLLLMGQDSITRCRRFKGLRQGGGLGSIYKSSGGCGKGLSRREPPLSLTQPSPSLSPSL